jgi:hypothetical protein
MTWKQLGGQLDATVSMTAERTMRRLTRRDALRAAIVSGVAGIAAVTLGQSPAWASTPSCSSCPSTGLDRYCCGPTYRCGHYGATCPSAGCPSGYSLCKNSSTAYCSCAQKHYNSQGYCCVYSSGSWIACNGAGKFGNGYYICYDCKGGPGGCNEWCTCLSACFCCNCTTPADVRAEQRRIQALQPAR